MYFCRTNFLFELWYITKFARETEHDESLSLFLSRFHQYFVPLDVIALSRISRVFSFFFISAARRCGSFSLSFSYAAQESLTLKIARCIFRHRAPVVRYSVHSVFVDDEDARWL